MQLSDILTTSCLFLEKLIREGEIKESAIPKRIRRSDIFLQLVNAQSLVKEKRGRGVVWVVVKPDIVQDYREHYCPDFIPDETKGERYNLIHATRNSKSSTRKSYRLIFVRSNVPFNLNGERIKNNAPIGKSLDIIEAPKLCFVENLENFMLNTRLVKDGYTLLFPIGRLGIPLFERVKAKHIMHFGDLDYMGLNEFARVKGFFPNATIYIPKNYFSQALKSGVTITKKQIASNALLRLCKEDNNVKRIYDFIQQYNLFLEQEGYDD